MVYDAADRYVVLFGGCVVFYCGGVTNDTWKFAGGIWTELSPASHPSARSYSAMTYDARDGYVLLFGGTNLGSTSFADTWIFSHGNWTNVTRGHAPPARFGAGIAFDAKDGYVVIFGGMKCWNCNSTALNDTWKFAGGVWTNITSAHSPSIRQPAQAMTYDPKDHYVVLFGGYIAGGWTLHDTWTFSHGVWSNITGATHPSSRGAPAFAYDPRDGYVLLYGGYSPPSFDSDTWSFVNGSWTQLTPTGSGVPPALTNSVMTFDARDGYAVLFSGLGSSGGQTWTYRGGVWSVSHSGTFVTVSWTLYWTGHTQSKVVCVRHWFRGCYQYARSTASVVASVGIVVTDITPNGTPTPSFSSSRTFVALYSSGTTNSPGGGFLSDTTALGSMQRNHTYQIQAFIHLQMYVTGATYKVGTATYNLAGSASLDLQGPYGGTLNWISVA
jgi:hypothetical protein